MFQTADGFTAGSASAYKIQAIPLHAIAMGLMAVEKA